MLVHTVGKVHVCSLCVWAVKVGWKMSEDTIIKDNSVTLTPRLREREHKEERWRVRQGDITAGPSSRSEQPRQIDGWEHETRRGVVEGKAEHERGRYDIQANKCNVSEMRLRGARKKSLKSPCAGSRGFSWVVINLSQAAFTSPSLPVHPSPKLWRQNDDRPLLTQHTLSSYSSCSFGENSFSPPKHTLRSPSLKQTLCRIPPERVHAN